MEQVVSNCFSYYEILTIHQRGKSSFKKIEDTKTTQKYQDQNFSVFWEMIYNKVKDHLPSKKFKIKGGYLNNTTKPYLIHSDGARNSSEDFLCNLLIPLEVKFYDSKLYDDDQHKFYVFDQTTDFATTFRLGKEEARKQEYYRLATSVDDYKSMIKEFTYSEFDDKFVIDNCNHISKQEFFGLSIKKILDWKIRDCIIFHPHSLHASSNFIRLGISDKTNITYSLYK